MSSFRIKIVFVFFCFLSCMRVSAQSPLSQILQPASSPSAPNAPADPLGRGTPYGTVFGFLQAAQSSDYGIAAQYLQMNAARRQAEGEQLAAKLKIVMDRAFAGSLKQVSTQPEGTLQEGVPIGRQKLGTMSSGDVEVDLDLVRVSDPTAGKIWLISSDTLTKVPELYDQVEARRVETKLPALLVKHQFAGMPLWQWLALLLALPVAAGLAWLILRALEIPVGWWAAKHGAPHLERWREIAAPVWLLAGTVVHRIIASYFGMPLLPRHNYFQVTAVAVIISANWILWRVIRWFLNRLRTRALAHGHGGTSSLILLGERLVKAVIVVVAIFAILTSLGFNMTTALAGLGIGGLAIGFGAQKTIENLFGGVSVLGDEVIRVGDVCRFGDRTGTVEDIGLRSTRVRTEERTLLAIPNGTVATINVENLSRRDKMLFKTVVGLRAETSPDHLRYVLSEIRRILYSHAKIESSSVRVRLIEFVGGVSNVEIVCYILTQDFNEFAAVREDLLLRAMDLINESGTTLAFPSQTLYLGRDSGVQKDKAEIAERKVGELRSSNQLPFPDFSNEDISSFRGSIDYPPAESAQRHQKRGTGQG
jgi:MscS family membrane protein